MARFCELLMPLLRRDCRKYSRAYSLDQLLGDAARDLDRLQDRATLGDESSHLVAGGKVNALRQLLDRHLGPLVLELLAALENVQQKTLRPVGKRPDGA